MQPLIVPLSSSEAADANRFGPKAANLATLGHAGLPIPDGFCLDAAAYQLQLAALDLEGVARDVASNDAAVARKAAVAIKLGLLEQPITPEILDPLLASWRALVARTNALTVVRSSALVEDRFGSSFAGQFESYLGLETEEDFLIAVRACWAALWATRVLRYMANHNATPAETAMGVLIQPLVSARAAGGGLSRTADGGMLLSATWGLGSAIAQGEVVPDRYELDSSGTLLRVVPGRKDHQVGCVRHHHHEPTAQTVAAPMVLTHCLSDTQAVELGLMLKKAEEIMGMPVEIEWALDDAGFKMLQSRPLHMGEAHEPDKVWLHHPRLNGHPAGVGWSEGTARVVNCECELERVGPGDILVTKVAGPALSQILPRVAGVVAELGGSTSHLASLARERGIPMVLGVLEATQRIPDGVRIAVDGVAGTVQWIH
jgi:phosphoenolpyruvate synthase/pyruvate phosphate dikinase